MELHTLGVDGGYTQQDVIELARILTGWTIDQPRDGGSSSSGRRLHDDGTKTLLGQRSAGAARTRASALLDLLASQPGDRPSHRLRAGAALRRR